MADPQHKPDWNPATSHPGETLTAEGRIAAAGAFARGFRNSHPRAVAQRRAALRLLGAFFAVCGAILLVAFVAM